MTSTPNSSRTPSYDVLGNERRPYGIEYVHHRKEFTIHSSTVWIRKGYHRQMIYVNSNWEIYKSSPIIHRKPLRSSDGS